MSMDAFELLQDIEKRCRDNSKPLPQQKAAGKIWQGIGFVASQMNFVAPLNEIIEVMPVPILTTLPGNVAWFRGIANMRGSLLPVTDLEGFILGKPITLSPLSRVLVVDFERTGVGFLVPGVLGVQRFVETNLGPAAKEESEYAPYVQGQIEEENIKWKVLSLKALSQTAQFYHVIKEMGA